MGFLSNIFGKRHAASNQQVASDSELGAWIASNIDGVIGSDGLAGLEDAVVVFDKNNRVWIQFGSNLSQVGIVSNYGQKLPESCPMNLSERPDMPGVVYLNELPGEELECVRSNLKFGALIASMPGKLPEETNDSIRELGKGAVDRLAWAVVGALKRN